jgi:type I restriction enzyme S subunit
VNSLVLNELFASRVPGLNPEKHPNEAFELWSIPAFDKGRPEIVLGQEIGSAKKRLEPGDVLLSKIVPHIRRAWVVGQKSQHRQIGSGEWIIFRSPKFDPNYLRHYLTSDGFHSRFMETIAGVGGSLLRARPDAVGKFPITLPPLDEQRRIASILDQAAALRHKRMRGIDALMQLPAAILAETIGDSIANPRGFGRKMLLECCDQPDDIR